MDNVKKIALALTHVLVALAVTQSTACSSTKAVKKAGGRPVSAAQVKELNALVAQGPLYFETDTDTLTESSQRLLQKIAAQMHRVPRVRVVVGGNADERGDTGYNLALGERRAAAARDYLARLGVPKERVKIVSFGEEQPLAVGHDEQAWSQNRRDDFTFLLPGQEKNVLSFGVDTQLSDVVATSDGVEQE
jgi:peptidoglycan-associated lipoprotein